MRLGMTASVALRIEDEAAGMVVPLAALTESDGGPVVFVVDPANKAVRKTPVTVGGTAERRRADRRAGCRPAKWW